ncbi:OprO/OprP family phosphate-selective porin [Fulvimarina endophytica]|nr:porin [Fulvimarina endophytica]
MTDRHYGKTPSSRLEQAGLILASVLLCAAALPRDAHAQSATNDSDLFPTNERYLQFGGDDRNITIAPFVQLDGGYLDFDPGRSGWRSEVALARLYLFGTYDKLDATFAYDFENESRPLRYLFLSYQFMDNLDVILGQQDEPFSLQDIGGSRFLPFASAGQSAALIPGDNVGGVARYSTDTYTVAAGVFGGDLNDGRGPGFEGLDERGVGVTARATWVPIYEESQIERGGDATTDGTGTQRVENLLHLGAAVSTKFDVTGGVSFSGNSNSALSSRSIASSPTFMGSSDVYRGNLEFARSVSSLSIQAELTGVYVDGLLKSGTAHGGYLYTTYFLTGEQRSYSRETGSFGRVVPKNPIDQGGFGALEVGARVDYLDLTDLGPDAGAQIGLSAVANLYLTKRFRLTADYSYTHGTAGSIDGLDVHAVTGRFQFAY